MTLKIDEVEISQPKLMERQVVAATCDRCGSDALCANASLPGRHGSGPWGEAEVLIQGGGIGHADLCWRCVEEFMEWVNKGSRIGRRGNGIQETPG